MRTQRLLIALTVLNFGMLALNLTRTSAAESAVAPILRGRAREVVDEQGRPRATITVVPADPKLKLPDGTIGYPETVLFRLIDGRGKPQTKIEVTNQGSALGLFGEDDPTHAALNSRGAEASIELRNKQGSAKVIRP